MFKLTVSKVGSDKTGVVTSSHRQVVLDHLEASAGRNGFEVSFHIPEGSTGDIKRDGQVVGEWKVEYA